MSGETIARCYRTAALRQLLTCFTFSPLPESGTACRRPACGKPSSRKNVSLVHTGTANAVIGMKLAALTLKAPHERSRLHVPREPQGEKAMEKELKCTNVAQFRRHNEREELVRLNRLTGLRFESLPQSLLIAPDMTPDEAPTQRRPAR